MEYLVAAMVAFLFGAVDQYLGRSDPGRGPRRSDEFLPGFWMIASTGYNPFWVLGGIVTGPFFGSLGHRWRIARWWIGPALVAGALCIEPLARIVADRLAPTPIVWAVRSRSV